MRKLRVLFQFLR